MGDKTDAAAVFVQRGIVETLFGGLTVIFHWNASEGSEEANLIGGRKLLETRPPSNRQAFSS